MEVCLFSCFRWCGYSWGAWVSFVMKDKFSVRVTKLLQGSVPHEPTAYLSAFNLLLTQCIMFILSKGCKPDSFVPHSSLKLSFTNIRGLGSNFDEFESFLESNSPDILALCETNLDDSTDWLDSGNFSMGGYFPLIRKDSITHMHCLAVYLKEGLSFARDLSLENSADSYLCFRLALLHSVSFFDSISSNIDEIPSINPSTNVFDFADFNVHHKDWLTYSGGAIGLVNSAIISLSQMMLLIWSNFLLGSLTVILTVLIIWIYLFLLPQVFVLQGLSLHWEILIRLLSQFPSIF